MFTETLINSSVTRGMNTENSNSCAKNHCTTFAKNLNANFSSDFVYELWTSNQVLNIQDFLQVFLYNMILCNYVDWIS